MKCLKRSAFNLRHQLKAERVQQLSRAPHFAKICVSGFSRNALVWCFALLVFSENDSRVFDNSPVHKKTFYTRVSENASQT